MKYQIAEYVVDTLQYRICLNGTVLPVEPKVFDLLVCLIRHRGRVLSREELFQKVWDGREVSDATLSNHVKSARKILGDNGEQQQTILTVRGRGYQFIAPVTELANGAGQPQATAQTTAGNANRPARPHRKVPLLLAAAALLLVGGVAPVWRYLNPPAPPQLLVVPFGVSDGTRASWQSTADSISAKVISNLREVPEIETQEEAVSDLFRKNRRHAFIREQLPQVQYVLGGVVDASSEQAVRITVQLDNLRSRQQAWTKDYFYPGRIDDTRPDELPSIVAPAISKSLQVEILEDEQRALAGLGESPTRNPKALRPYVRGWKHLQHYDPEHLRKAIREFDKAIELDPDFYGAHLARGEAYRWLFGYYDVPADMLPHVVHSLKRALELRPGSAEALSALGLTYVMAWEWEDAWRTLNEARKANPDLALTHLGFATYYSALGEKELVKQSLQLAVKGEFLNVEVADWGNWALFMVGAGDTARDWINTMIQNHRDAGLLFAGAGVGAYIRGDYAKAVKLAEAGATLDPSPVVKLMLAQAYAKAGRTDDAWRKLKEAESDKTYTCRYETAVTYLFLGDKEKAMENLKAAVPARSNCMVFLHEDPRLDAIREDSRYRADYLKRLEDVGLDDARRDNYQRDRLDTQLSHTQ